MTAIEVSHATVRYPDGTTAVRDVSLSIAPGERVALVGASGSGKTTLARAILGLVPCSSGTIHLFGDVPDGRARTTPGSAVQLLFQSPRAMLHPALTLRQLLSESARVHAKPRAHVDTLLDRVQLTHRADARPAALSGGERRRAGIARVLMAEPDLLIADEPTTGLDAALKPAIAELLFAPERTTLMVTHDLWLAATYTSRMLVLHQGALVDDVHTLSELTHPAAIALATAAGAL